MMGAFELLKAIVPGQATSPQVTAIPPPSLP